VVIAMHCNLRPPDLTPVVLRLKYEAKYEAHTKFEVRQPIHS